MEYLVYIKTKNTKLTLALLSGIIYTIRQGVLLGSCGNLFHLIKNKKVDPNKLFT